MLKISITMQSGFKFQTAPKICNKCKSTRFDKLDWENANNTVEKVYNCCGCGMVYDPLEYTLDEALKSKEFQKYLAANASISVASDGFMRAMHPNCRSAVIGRWINEDDQMDSAHYALRQGWTPTVIPNENIDYAENVERIIQEVGAATMQDPKTVAYALHSVIEGIGNAPQHKATKILSAREIVRRKRLSRPVTANYYRDPSTGHSYVTEKVLRGKTR